MRAVFASLVIVVAVACVVETQSPTVSEVLSRASRYVAAYENRFSVLVAEERYVQETRRQTVTTGGNLSQQNPGGGFSGPRGAEQRRVLRADYLIVKLEGGGGWMPFRDVFEVDGRAVRDREDRLAALFLKPSASSFAQAARIMAESTRHNIGSITRTINIPTLALLLLHPDVVSRFTFTRGDVDAEGDWAIEYREEARPTLIKTMARGAHGLASPTADLPLRGRMWIDPISGALSKTELVASDALLQTKIVVTYRHDPTLDLRVPAQMDEFYSTPADERDIVGTATYTNYRRFQVSTAEAIKKPPM